MSSECCFVTKTLLLRFEPAFVTITYMKTSLLILTVLMLASTAEAKKGLDIRFEPSPSGELRWATWKWCGISYRPDEISDTEARMFFEYEMSKTANCSSGDKHNMRFAVMFSTPEAIGYFYTPKAFDFLDNEEYMDTIRVRARKLARIFGKEFRIGFQERISQKIIAVVSSND